MKEVFNRPAGSPCLIMGVMKGVCDEWFSGEQVSAGLCSFLPSLWVTAAMHDSYDYDDSLSASASGRMYNIIITGASEYRLSLDDNTIFRVIEDQ